MQNCLFVFSSFYEVMTLWFDLDRHRSQLSLREKYILFDCAWLAKKRHRKSSDSTYFSLHVAKSEFHSHCATSATLSSEAAPQEPRFSTHIAFDVP